jgi:hypothetical protein
MEKIDSIKILQANGFGGSGGNGGSTGDSGSVGSKGLPNQLVDAALNYRMNLPLIDKMLEELGLDPSSAEGLSELLKGKTETLMVEEKKPTPKAVRKTPRPVKKEPESPVELEEG